MISYTGTRKMKNLKTKMALLSFGLMIGFAYEAFAEDSAKGNALKALKAAKAKKTAAPVESVVKEKKTSRRAMSIEQHTAEIIKLEPGTTEVFVANPEIADVSLQASGTAYVYGKKPGNTTIFASGQNGKRVLDMNVQVTFNIGPIQRAIAASYPNESVKIISTPSGVILEGEVSSAKASRDVVNIVQRFMGGDDAIINNMGISAPTQVYLAVKVAEISRNVLHELDISWGTLNNVKSFSFGLLSGPGNIVPGVPGAPFTNNFTKNAGTPPLNTIAGRARGRNFDITSFLDALNQESLGTILAEPNLVALSGETAKVLVGGEVPYPVPQGSNTISIEFKQYGISLDFTPTILSNNRISLRVRPEVSEIDKPNGIDVTVGSAALKVPAFSTRRAETSVEMGSGQSLAIAGLFSKSMNNVLDETPFLADVPVLGALFKSTKFQRRETELVIIVTPYMVEPVKNHDLRAPTDTFRMATQLGMILGQRLNAWPSDSRMPAAAMTNNVAATGEAASVEGAIFQTDLASSGESAPANDQSRSAEKMAMSKPEDLSFNSEVNLAGDAGFYTE